VSPVKYGLGLYIPDDRILHSHRRENLKPYMLVNCHFLTLSHLPTTGLCDDAELSAQLWPA
jgi:hypothetical protein